MVRAAAHGLTGQQLAVGGDVELEAAVAAIYLRGLARPANPAPRGWPEVVSSLRCSLGVHEPVDTGSEEGCGWAREGAAVLAARGLFLEGGALESSAARQARSLVANGLAVTVASSNYPARWVARLGPAAPPALYCQGARKLLARPGFGIVGSRRPPFASRRLAASLALSASQAGFAVVSGGAPGVDRAAAAGALALVELWPCGLGRHWGGERRGEWLRLSLWPPREFFATPAAMERNALIFALAEATFVAHARFKEGGAWHGAASAMRRRAGVVLVPAEEPRDWGQAWKALRGLGARPFDAAKLSDADGFREALAAAVGADPQPGLPGLSVGVSRAMAAY